MNRRDFLRSAAAGATAAALSRSSFADAVSSTPVQLTLHPNQLGAHIDLEFLGLSYESAQLAHPEYFSASNQQLVGFLRHLAPRGIVRIGGNTSEYAFWTPHPSPHSAADPYAAAVNPDKGHKPAPPTQTTPQSIRNLREFLDATGWRCYYGLNLGKGTPQQAADEAAFVANTLGNRLVLFQIGNEADLYHQNGLRPANYDYAAFANDWQQFYDAIKARVPTAKFAGPDTAGVGVWVREFAQQFHSKVELLTSHFYAEGPPNDPRMTLDHLLDSANDRWDNGLPKIKAAMASSHLPYRLSETNSCYSGGKEGVSNTFGSALWAADLMLKITDFGGSGINFHGGGYGWYAPIVGTLPNGFVARPEYYSMLLFSQLLGGRRMASDLQAPAGRLKAYAIRAANGAPMAVVLNKEAAQSYQLKIQANTHAERMTVERLIAPSLDDTADVTFDAVPVGQSGNWHPARKEQVAVHNGSAVCEIPAGSAALLSWG